MQIPAFRGRRPVFLGDDTSDENGFEAVNELNGISVRIKPQGSTAALFGLAGVDAALAWLDEMSRGETAKAARLPQRQMNRIAPGSFPVHAHGREFAMTQLTSLIREIMPAWLRRRRGRTAEITRRQPSHCVPKMRTQSGARLSKRICLEPTHRITPRPGRSNPTVIEAVVSLPRKPATHCRRHGVRACRRGRVPKAP